MLGTSLPGTTLRYLTQALQEHPIAQPCIGASLQLHALSHHHCPMQGLSFHTSPVRCTASVLHVPGMLIFGEHGDGGRSQHSGPYKSAVHQLQSLPCLYFSSSFRKWETSTTVGAVSALAGHGLLKLDHRSRGGKRSTPNPHASLPVALRCAAWFCAPGLCSSLALGCAGEKAAKSFPASPIWCCFCTCPSEQPRFPQAFRLLSAEADTSYACSIITSLPLRAGAAPCTLHKAAPHWLYNCFHPPLCLPSHGAGKQGTFGC